MLTFMGTQISFVTIQGMLTPKQCTVSEWIASSERGAYIVSYASYRNRVGIASQVESCVRTAVHF